MGRTFASNHGMWFIETSALSNIGIDDVFKCDYHKGSFTKSAKK